ncbi:MAG: sugar phosphate isomerase/epimerase [Candidatus Omnitrophica bacterium]|nr:sugar phosphate isomerase/epimerase [Candidatus Omnitrophota bacterium]
MDASIKKFFKPGIVHFMAYPETTDGSDVEQTIKKIACDEFFEVIEITCINDPEIRCRIRDMLCDSGMEVYLGVQPVLLKNKLNLNDEDENNRKRTIEIMKQCIDQAYEMGAKGISFLSGKYNARLRDCALELLLDSTERICDYAKGKGPIMIELEVFDYEVDKKSLIGPTYLAKKFCEKIKRKFDNFGLLVDLSHIPLIGESPYEAIIPVRDFITHIHIGNCLISDKNSPLYGDYHPPFGYPGTEIGIRELADFLQIFIDIGFFNTVKRIPVSFEVKPIKGQDPDVIVANSKRVLEKAWLLIE